MTIARMRAALGSSDAWQRRVQHPGFDDVPVPDFSFLTAGKLLADEMLRAYFARSSSDFWASESSVDPAARLELDRLLEVYGEKGWLDEPAGFHREPPDLDRVRIVSGRRGHHRFEHMSFESDYEPDPDDPVRERWLGYEANRSAHAWLLRHSRQENRPWVICLHGIGMGNPYMDFPAFRRDYLYRTLGFNVLWYVKPFHGPRGRGVNSHETFLRGIGNLVHVQAQCMWDLRRILSWVARQHDSQVGVYGLSLGGYAASLLTTLVDDVDVVVAGMPGTDFVDLFENDLRSEFLAPLWRDARRALQVVSPFAAPSRVPREGRFIFGGLVDRLTPPAGVRRLWLHWERPRIQWYEGSHMSFLLEPRVRDLLDEAYTRLAAPN